MLARRSGWVCIPVPGLVPPRTFRMAWVAPKLMRREKGVTGGPRGPSSSSMAFSSIESALVDRLPRRMKAEGVVGEVPERPSVVTESLRRWSLTAAAARGVGNDVGGCCETELFRKKLVKALEVMEPRRWRAMSFALLAEFPLSEDMVKEGGGLAGGESGKFYIGRVGDTPNAVPAAEWPVAKRERVRQILSLGFRGWTRVTESYVVLIEVVRGGRVGGLGWWR